jgi:hypothetical protein
MSGASSIGSFAYRWNLIASGVASVDATERTSNAFHQNSGRQDASTNRNTVESATVTKRMSDGAMIIFRYDKQARVSPFSGGSATGGNVNISA